MHTVEEGNIPPVIFFRNRLICRKHEILYNFLGFFADHGANFGNLPLFVENNLGLREIKVQSASLYALMTKQAGKLSHMKEQVLKGEIGGIVLCSFFVSLSHI